MVEQNPMQPCTFCKTWTLLLPNGLCQRCTCDDRKVFTLIQMGVEGKELIDHIAQLLEIVDPFAERGCQVTSKIKEYLHKYKGI